MSSSGRLYDEVPSIIERGNLKIREVAIGEVEKGDQEGSGELTLYHSHYRCRCRLHSCHRRHGDRRRYYCHCHHCKLVRHFLSRLNIKNEMLGNRIMRTSSAPLTQTF